MSISIEFKSNFKSIIESFYFQYNPNYFIMILHFLNRCIHNFSTEISNKRTKSLGHSSAKLEPSNKVGLRISYARAADWIRLDSRINNSALRERTNEGASNLNFFSLHIEILTASDYSRPSVGALRKNTCLCIECVPRALRSLCVAQINSPQEKKNCPAACDDAYIYTHPSDELLSRRKIFMSSRDHQPPNYIIWIYMQIQLQ
jgi:hypothetical protein